MPCKHLLHYSRETHAWSVASCTAKATPYVPSLVELERYCRGGNHTACPAYLCFFGPGRLKKENALAVGIS